MAQDERQPNVPERRHPTYNLRGLDQPQSPTSPTLNPNFVVTPESRIAEDSLWRSGYITERLVGLDVGDADNDGLNELVYVTVQNVYVTRYVGGNYTQLAAYKLPENSRAISVDVFDVDGDGTNEIVVSGQNDQTHQANSFIFNYRGGNSLDVVASGINYYLRVIGPANSRVLVAQKPGTTGGTSFSGAPHYASFANGKVVMGTRVDLPPQVNIFNFNQGTLGSERLFLTSYIKFPTEHLVLTDATGGKVWESHDEYGGTINHINQIAYGDNGRSLEYLPARILIADIDQDGNNEVIVAKNNLGGSRLFRNLRSFNSGTIEARKFSNLSLIPYFNSGNLLPGPAVDYQLADFDNNGSLDLVVAILIEAGSGMLEGSRAIIFSYNNLYVVQPPTPSAGSQGQ